MTPFVRSAYNYDMDAASLQEGLKCEDPSLAQQQFKEESDINTIVERFKLTGMVPQLTKLPSSQDYEGIFDFQTAMNKVREAQEQFMTLPAKLRTRFQNQPQKFLEFVSDEDNRDEAIKLGLIAKPEPAKVEPVTTTTGAAPNGSSTTGTSKNAS